MAHFGDFPKSITNVRILPSIRPAPLPFLSFPVYYNNHSVVRRNLMPRVVKNLRGIVLTSELHSKVVRLGVISWYFVLEITASRKI